MYTVKNGRNTYIQGSKYTTTNLLRIMTKKSQDNLLLIFTRNPELGKVKSRLAKSIGQKNALDIYKKLLQHTHDVVIQSNATKRVGYSETIGKDDIWHHTLFEKFAQEGHDLGQRIESAFKQAFSDGYKKVIIIGSDLYDLRPYHLEQAFQSLSEHQAVVGPAKDGGYYLLGMTALIPTVFTHKKWGEDTVLKDTLKDLEAFSVAILEELNDIDYVEDLEPYPEFASYINENQLKTRLTTNKL